MQKEPPKAGADKVWDVVVVGGGPAGMMAAGRAAERGCSVVLLEKSPGLGAKLLITGGGRCNVLNAELDERALLARFKDAGKFLFSAFSKFGVPEALGFFESRGMPVKVEAGKRAFPVSDSAQSVWDVLLGYMKAGGVSIRTGAAVKCFMRESDGDGKDGSSPAPIGAVKLAGGELVRGRAFVLATGGKSHPETGSTGDGFAWLAELGHAVAEPTAALVPVEIEDAWAKKLAGVSLPNAKLAAYQNGQKQSTTRGKTLFAHFGLSGPAVLNMSSEIAELLTYGDVELSLDLLPDHDFSTLNDALQALFAANINKKLKNVIGGAGGLVPKAFAPVVIERSGIDGEKMCNAVTREERVGLMKLLKDLRMKVRGLLGADKAIVTSGGVALEEVDFRTMRSRLVPNLYLVGDILDIDRPSGGFSLQLCWTTGFVAGDSV